MGRANQSESNITSESAHATSGTTQRTADSPILWCSEHRTHESCIANRLDAKAFCLTVFIYVFLLVIKKTSKHSVGTVKNNCVYSRVDQVAKNLHGLCRFWPVCKNFSLQYLWMCYVYGVVHLLLNNPGKEIPSLSSLLAGYKFKATPADYGGPQGYFAVEHCPNNITLQHWVTVHRVKTSQTALDGFTVE